MRPYYKLHASLFITNNRKGRKHWIFLEKIGIHNSAKLCFGIIHITEVYCVAIFYGCQYSFIEIDT